MFRTILKPGDKKIGEHYDYTVDYMFDSGVARARESEPGPHELQQLGVKAGAVA